MKLAVIMDPIHTIKPYKDTSFALMLAAQALGAELYYCEISDLFIENNLPNAFFKKITVHDKLENFFEIKNESIERLDSMNVILMRKDPPINTAYLHATQILDLTDQQHTRIINHPKSLLNFNEKLTIHAFPTLCPPTVVSAKIDKIISFIKTNHSVICKPIDEMGGKNVFKIEANDPNTQVILEFLTHHETRQMICQKFIPDISQGDKRILMINGEPLPYALARIPAKGSVRGNLAAGGQGKGNALDEHDLKICQAVSPFLKQHGLYFVGLDVIGRYLTEINVTSPTCLRELENIYQIPFSKQIMESLLS